MSWNRVLSTFGIVGNVEAYPPMAPIASREVSGLRSC